MTIYESDMGVDAFEFHVGDLYEIFGEPTEDSTKRVVRFNENSQLVSLQGFAGYTGIKAVKLARLDQNCIVSERERAKQQAEFDTALTKAMENQDKHSENFDNTILIGCLMIVFMFFIGLVFCLCAGRDMMDRINRRFKMSNEHMAHVNVVKYDYESIGGMDLMRSKLEEAQQSASNSEMVVIEDL